ncbi:MAG TPA: protoporphyrinogen oxidase [Jiangellaceae bacterium]
MAPPRERRNGSLTATAAAWLHVLITITTRFGHANARVQSRLQVFSHRCALQSRERGCRSWTGAGVWEGSSVERHVVVVGGGISGLAAAYYLRAGGVEVTVLEASEHLGGPLRVSDLAGLPVDEGAESLLNRRPEAVELAREVGLGDDVVYPASITAGVWSRGRIRPLPPGTVMGVPVRPEDLATILDETELARIESDRRMPGLPTKADVAIGRLVTERMGAAVAERLVEPLLGGVYAGHADELSLRATVPALAAAAQKESSLLGAAEIARQQASTPDGTPVFAGIRGGVGRLPDAVATASGASIRTRTTVRSITPPAAGAPWRLETGPAPFAEFMSADAVVLAVPPAPAARLLGPVAPDAARELHDVEQASVAIVTLAVPRSAFAQIPESSGFLIPPVEGRTIKAVTLSSVKWPWLAELAGDLVVLRASVGRHRQVAELQRPDDEIVDLVLADLADALGLTDRPVATRVTRWGGALPQYAVGHVERMDRVRAAVANLRGLAVCGAAYDGVGIAACVGLARSAAESVLADLKSRAGEPYPAS